MNSTPERANWIKEKISANRLFLLIFCGAAVYDIWRLFSIPPWYDELYTYETFIDRGVVYSMIHWPLPNNHVFFSALSALVNKLCSPYLGLRGISLLASLGSLMLLYRILKKVVSGRMAAAGTALFAAMYNVTQQAAQGRGYALSGFLLLAALNLLYEICIPAGKASSVEKIPSAERIPLEKENFTAEHAPEEKSGRKQGKAGKRKRFLLYAGYAFCLTGGLYTIPSNLYWVVPICLAGGLFLLVKKDFSGLLQLVWASLAAAVAAFGLYAVIWLAIGSNFLVKDETGIFYGMSHFQVLLQAPLTAFLRGMQAMLSDPNIQSVGRAQFAEGFFDYIFRVLNQVYPGGGWLLPVPVAAGVLCMVIRAVLAFRRREWPSLLLAVYCVVLVGMVPVFLTVQCVFPYLRVFTYLGSVLAILFVLTVCSLGEWAAGRLRALKKRTGTKSGRTAFSGGPALAAALAAICLMGLLWSREDYNAGYDSRDNHIYAALSQLDETQVDTVLVGDVYARLNLYFHIQKCRGKELAEDTEHPDYVLMDKIQTGPEGEGLVWPYERDTSDFPWEWIEEHMEVVYEDDVYIAYQVVR